MPLAIDPIIITDKAFDAETALSDFRRACSDVGAIVSFTGIVREDADVLTLSHYPGFTEAEMRRIGTAALERWDVSDYKIIHRIGDMLPKSDAPFWKKETLKGKTRWIEPRGQDQSDMKRWSQ